MMLAFASRNSENAVVAVAAHSAVGVLGRGAVADVQVPKKTHEHRGAG